MAHLSNDKFVDSTKVYTKPDSAHGSSFKNTESSLFEPEERNFPGGIPPGHENMKKMSYRFKETPRAAQCSLSGSQLLVTDDDPEEMGAVTGGKQRLGKDPHEFFQQTQGQPATILARDRVQAGFMSAQIHSTRLYTVGEGYARPGIHTKEEVTWTTSNRMPRHF